MKSVKNVEEVKAVNAEQHQEAWGCGDRVTIFDPEFATCPDNGDSFLVTGLRAVSHTRSH